MFRHAIARVARRGSRGFASVPDIDAPAAWKLGRLNHVALAVPDIKAASKMWREALGASVSELQELPEHGVTVAFVDAGNTHVELLESLGDGSPIAAFLKKSPSGGLQQAISVRFRARAP